MKLTLVHCALIEHAILMHSVSFNLKYTDSENILIFLDTTIANYFKICQLEKIANYFYMHS